MNLYCSINCHITKGQLYAVVGQVGAGKTSLLSAILGEIKKLSGTVTIKGCMKILSWQMQQIGNGYCYSAKISLPFLVN